MATTQPLPANDDSVQHYGRDFDHLGSLNRTLRDLQGFDTLAHELIQNADDAPKTTRLVFDVRDDALIVENNGRFSDCGHLKDRQCRWKHDPKIDYSCDFHRFKLISGGGKRDEAGTTGAFGIGFTSVYQITDHPEVISAGHHWILDEMSEESNGRITGREVDDSVQGTCFVLPWARDAHAPLRRELSVKAITDEDIEELFRALMDAVPPAMPFLRHLAQIEIRRNGITRCDITCDRTLNRITICNGQHTMLYTLIEGSFASEADDLRRRYPDLIERKREARVQVAVPIDHTVDGLLYVTLPTRHRTGLPFLLNADFFPKSDRKSVNFDSNADYQTQWNRAAIVASASAVARNTIRLRDTLPQERFWDFVRDVRNVFESTKKGNLDTSFRSFWQRLESWLRDQPVVRTARNEWMKAAETVLLAKEEDRDAVPFLEGAGLHIVDPKLRSHFPLMRELGIPVLDSARLSA